MLSSIGFQLFYVSAVSLITAGIFLAFSIGQPTRNSAARNMLGSTREEVVFLFDDTDIVDATPAAKKLLGRQANDSTDWEEFLSIFGPHFPHLRTQLSNLASEGTREISAPDNPNIMLRADFWDGYARIKFDDNSAGQTGNASDLLTLVSLEEEVKLLRGIAEDAPQLIWKEDSDGAIAWANKAYLSVANRLADVGGANVATWPPKPVFDGLQAPNAETPHLSRRAPIQLGGNNSPHWYEVTSVLRGGEVLHFATDAEAVVKAEATQKDFVQTLGNTFAQLSVGLAIFDSQRRLMIFNPALLDLTGLSVEFLSSRPLIHTVMDQLRESQMLPEPKNYSSWREEIVALETEAKNGTYCENWNLLNGLTYRVTGKPHPNGATAFLFEDISAEVSLTRRFRSELEMNQVVLDTIQEAVAVFSSSGALRMCNQAYYTLWHGVDRGGLSESGILEETRIWQDASGPTSIWADIREFIGGFGSRTAWDGDFILNDGRYHICSVSSLPDNATLVRFRQNREVPSAIQHFHDPQRKAHQSL